MALTLLACSQSSPPKRAPVIDDLELPSSATASAAGVYAVSGTISYHDDDEAVTLLRMRISASGQVTPLALPSSSKVDKFPFEIQLAGAKGPFSMDISIVSASGIESAALHEAITLE